MKTIKLLFILIVASVIAGCTVTKQKEYPPVDDSGYTLVEADFKALLFSDKDMVWPEGASIGVYGTEQGYNEPYAIKKAGVGLGQAFFYGPVVKGTLAAYYPYSPSYIGDAAAMPFLIESEQVYGEDPVEMYLKYTPSAFAHMNEGKMEFHYPNALLRLTVGFAEAVKVKGLRLDSEKSGLSGLGVIMQDGTIRMTENADNHIVLNCGEGVLSRADDDSLIKEDQEAISQIIIDINGIHSTTKEEETEDLSYKEKARDLVAEYLMIDREKVHIMDIKE